MLSLATNQEARRPVSFKKLIAEPTPIHELKNISKKWDTGELYIKREDLTSFGYGGNKVRNLEFILGEALAQGKTKLVTSSPVGSNFSAALSYHAAKLGMPVKIFQFVPQQSPQILRHNQFISDQNPDLKTYNQYGLHLSASRAYLAARMESLSDPNAFFVSPGGSNVLGARGHMEALKEMVSAGLEPDYIVVGVGTCGTIAGLLAGIKCLHLQTKIIGVRCVNPVVCHKARIVQLADAVLRATGCDARVSFSDFDLVDPPGEGLIYGKSTDLYKRMKSLFFEQEGVVLDTTYTSKVAARMKIISRCPDYREKSILYWHTYSASLG